MHCTFVYWVSLHPEKEGGILSVMQKNCHTNLFPKYNTFQREYKNMCMQNFDPL
jgi:hypothetical protein